MTDHCFRLLGALVLACSLVACKRPDTSPTPTSEPTQPSSDSETVTSDTPPDTNSGSGCAIIPLAANSLAGSCSSLSDKIASGVSDGTKAYSGKAGVTLVDWKWRLSPKITKSAGQYCASVPAGTSVLLSEGARPYSVQWSAPSKCSTPAKAWQDKITAHECHHVQQASDYAKSRPATWTLPQAVKACAATRADAIAAFRQQVDAVVQPEIGRRNDEIKKDFDAYDSSPGGAPAVMDCNQCQDDAGTPDAGQCVYCNCNKTSYTSASECVKSCKVSLGCFTGICEPCK